MTETESKSFFDDIKNHTFDVEDVLAQIYPYSVKLDVASWPLTYKRQTSTSVINDTFNSIYNWCQTKFTPDTFTYYDRKMYFKNQEDVAYFILKWANLINQGTIQ